MIEILSFISFFTCKGRAGERGKDGKVGETVSLNPSQFQVFCTYFCTNARGAGRP